MRRTFARHQLGAVLATGCDFATMSCAISLVHVRPSLATALGAAVGATVNFLTGRRWVFSAHGDPWASQATRYLSVSTLSLLLNATGVYILAERLSVQYLLARAIVALLVSVCWNYPLHRYFVFSAKGPAK
jgi:putative flippase GtrA